MRGHPPEHAIPAALPGLPPSTFDPTAQWQSATTCPLPLWTLLCSWELWSPDGGRKTGLERRKGGVGGSWGHIRTSSWLGDSVSYILGTYTECMAKPTLYLSPAWLCFSVTKSKHNRAALTSPCHLGSVSLPEVACHEFTAQSATGTSVRVFKGDTFVCLFTYSTKICGGACSVPRTFLVSGDTVVSKILISSLATLTSEIINKVNDLKL